MRTVNDDEIRLLDRCKDFEFDSYDKYTDENRNFDSSIDPDQNFFAEFKRNCKYVTQENFTASVTVKNGISILHVNCRSIKCNFEALRDFLLDLKFECDVIAVSESWLNKDDDLSKIIIEGYTLENVNRKNRKGGGVLLYISDALSFIRTEKLCYVIDDMFECIGVELKMSNCKNISVICIYRTPNTNLHEFNQHLTGILKSVENKSVLLAGDFNVNLLHVHSCESTREFLDCLYGYGFYPLIDKPTRVSLESATLIDNIFTNIYKPCRSKIVVTANVSDHFPVFSHVDYGINCKKTSKPTYTWTRHVTDTGLLSIRADLENVDWNDVQECENVNDAYNLFILKIMKLYDTYCPMRKVRYDKRSFTKPWLTKGLLKSCRRKNKLYYSFVENRTAANETKYKNYKNCLVKYIRLSKKMYYSRLLEKHKGDMKQTWGILKRIIRKGSQSHVKPPECFVNEKNRHIRDGTAIANGFNDFFVNVGPKLAAKIDSSACNGSVVDYLSPRNESSMYITPTSEIEVVNIVKQLKGKKSSDINNLDMNFVKQIITSISKPFAHICNMSLNAGEFPDGMKIAKVVPLYKSGDKAFFSNYRPVSLLPQFSKILEKIFCVRMVNFVNKCNLLHESQYGFREKRSTSLALCELVEQLTDAADRKEVSIGVFVDLKKAFDTLNHDVLLRKLEHYGIRGVPLQWLSSYLSNRKQYVKYNGCESSFLGITCGVPQGSVTGPILFILYINDICNASQRLKMVLFADDTNGFCSGKELSDLVKTVNFELQKLNTWFKLNKLSLNIEKTSYMVFANNCIPDVLPIKVGNKVLNRVYETKFLGVYIDCKLKWKCQISSVCSKLSKCLAVLSKATEVLDKKCLKLLYNSLFFPYMNYCCEVWGNAYKSSLATLIVLQKRAIRVICKVKKRDHTNVLFKSCGILPFKDLVNFKIAVLMYKGIHKSLPMCLQERISVFSVVKRNNRVFQERYCRTSLKSHCLSVHGVKYYNSLPNDIRNVCNVKQLQFRLKHYLLNKL